MMYKAIVLAGFVGTVFVSAAVSHAQKPGSRAGVGGGMAPASQPQPGQDEGNASAAQIQQGTTLFNQHCVNCHDANKSLRASKDISGWRATVQKMSTKKDANIPQDAHEPIAVYLASLSAGPSAAGGGSAAGSAMSSFGQFFGGFTAPSDELQAPTLKDKAVFAFQSGNPKQAYAMLEAYALQASDEEAMAVLKDYRWASHHKRPQLGLNFAVGVTIKNPQNADEIAPIGVAPSNNRGSGFPGGQPGMGGGSKNGARSGAPASVLVVNSLEDAAGVYGTQFVEAMRAKHDEGVWSMAFREYGLGTSGGFGGPFAGGGMPQPGFGAAPGFSGGGADQPNSFGTNGPPNGGGESMRPNSTSSNGPPQGYSGGSGGMRPNSTSSSGPPAGYNGGSGGMRPNSTSSSGPPAGYNGGSGGMRPNSTSSNGPPAGYSGGSGGMKPDSGASGGGSSSGPTKAPLQFPQQGGGFFDPDGPQGGAPGPGGRGPGGRNAPRPNGPMSPGFGGAQLPAGASSLAPCMTFIGSDDTTKLVKKAIAEGYDALIIFEVELQVNRLLKTVINDTRIRVLLPSESAKETKAVLTSKRLNNIQARKSAAKGESDGVDEAVELIVKKIEETFGLQPIPTALSPEIVSTKRIPALIAEKSDSVLDRLSEVNLYYANGLIYDNQKAAAFEKIAGQQGTTIATGTPEEKLAAVEKLLQREFK